MNEIIVYETEHGSIQIESFEQSRPTRGREKITIQRKFGEAVELIKSIGNSVVSKVREISESPNEVSLELGIKFSIEAGAIIAKTSSEGTFKLTLNWKKEHKERA